MKFSIVLMTASENNNSNRNKNNNISSNIYAIFVNMNNDLRLKVCDIFMYIQDNGSYLVYRIVFSVHNNKQ